MNVETVGALSSRHAQIHSYFHRTGRVMSSGSFFVLTLCFAGFVGVVIWGHVERLDHEYRRASHARLLRELERHE